MREVGGLECVMHASRAVLKLPASNFDGAIRFGTALLRFAYSVGEVETAYS